MGYLNERLRAFYYAFEGLKTFFTGSKHAQIHILAALSVAVLGFILGCEKSEWLILILTMALVLAMEAMNSALEYAVDLASPEKHPLAKKAKDVAAGAVLISAIFALIIGLIIFIPKIVDVL